MLNDYMQHKDFHALFYVWCTLCIVGLLLGDHTFYADLICWFPASTVQWTHGCKSIVFVNNQKLALSFPLSNFNLLVLLKFYNCRIPIPIPTNSEIVVILFFCEWYLTSKKRKTGLFQVVQCHGLNQCVKFLSV